MPRSTRTERALLAYVHDHPDDAVARRALLAWAHQHVGRAGFQGGCDFRPAAAYRILLDLGSVHDGMTLDEAEAELGKPWFVASDAVSWYANSTCHINPGLRARIVDGRLTQFRITSG
jgi:hypothetical protein